MLSYKPANRPYSLDELLSAVKRIALQADANNPSAVSQRRFDEARAMAQVACPRAADVSRKLKTPWRELLDSVFDEDVNDYHQMASRLRGRGDKFPIDHGTIVSAVRLAASRRGTSTLRPHEYEEERQKAVGDSRGPNRRQREARWPPASRIETIGWNRVVSEAGLEIPPPIEKERGFPFVDAVELLLECRGYLPARRETTKAFAVARTKLSQPPESFESTVELLRGRRHDQGKWTPPHTPAHNDKPNLPAKSQQEEQRALEALRQTFKGEKRLYWDRERIEAGLETALAKLQPGESLTQKRLRKLAKDHPGAIPHPSVVSRFAAAQGTNLKELRAQALERVGNRR